MPKNLGLYNNDLSIPRKKDLDALETRIGTNEDDIAIVQSDIKQLNSDVNAVEAVLGSKQDTIVGGASTIVKDDLVADRALVSNASGKVVVSDVTSAELGYLSGVTSNVQTQLNKKAFKSQLAVKADFSDLNALRTQVNLLQNRTINASSVAKPFDSAKSYATGDYVTKYTGAQGPKNLYKAKVDVAAGDFDVEQWEIVAVIDELKDMQTQIEGKVSTTLKVNGHELTGDVTVSKSDIGLGNVDNVKQYSENNPPPYPVVSVNGKIGKVNISATDVGALPDTTVIPTNNNQLTNGAGYITASQAPVTSVNGMTGAVTISAGGNSVVTQSAQPSGQKVNDLWFQV